MNLSSREKKIILSILRSSEGITLKEISEEIGVSRRTVLREINSVYEWFSKRGFTIERHTSKGINLDLSQGQKEMLYQELNTEVIVHYYTKKERSLYIITELLQSKEALKLSYFSTVLGVSEASISTDLNSVEHWLKKYELELYRKQGYGIEVLGSEKNKRRALINIIYEMLDGNQLRSAVQQQLGINQPKVKVTSKVRLNLLNMIDVETIKMIENVITIGEKDMGFTFAESSYTALAVHLALAVKRIMNKETISINRDILLEIMQYEEYDIAKKLIEALKEQLGIDIPDDEIGYVTLHLKGARYKGGLIDSSFIKLNERIISNYELTSMINQMIKIASEESGYDLRKVDSLLIGLVDHLRPAINRIQLHLDIRNPLIDKIKEEYPKIYEISEKASAILTPHLGVELPESEIGFIAMHIGSAIEQLKRSTTANIKKYNVVVTCISGIGTSKMLAERLKKEFKNINIVDVFASTNVKNEWLERNEIDLILSTVYFDNPHTPVLVVNPLLLDSDIKKINTRLQSIAIISKEKVLTNEQDFENQLMRIRQYTHAILEILHHLEIVSGLKAKSYDELIQLISKKITVQHQELFNDFLKREAMGKIIFEKEGVSFLHCRSASVETLHVGVYRNQYDIVDGEYVYNTLLVLVAPLSVEQYKLEVMGEISSRVVSEENFLHEIKNLSESGLYKRIKQFLQQFYNKKIEDR